MSRYDRCRNPIGSNLLVTRGVRIFAKHIEKKRSCVWVWPDTLFWLLWGIGVVMLCVCRCAMNAKHNSLTVVFFFCLFTLSFVFFGEINVVVLAVAFFLLRFLSCCYCFVCTACVINVCFCFIHWENYIIPSLCALLVCCCWVFTPQIVLIFLLFRYCVLHPLVSGVLALSCVVCRWFPNFCRRQT